MSKGTTFERALLDWIFLDGADPLDGVTTYWAALHTANPEDGDQESFEADYPGYDGRRAMARGGSPADWTRDGSTIHPADVVEWAQATGAGDAITHWSIGTHETGPGMVVYVGTVGPMPAIEIENGVTPKMLTDTSIAED